MPFFYKSSLIQSQVKPSTVYQPHVGSTFIQRLSLLSKKNRKRLACVCALPLDHQTFKYRIDNLCEILNQSSAWVASYFFLEEIPQLLHNMDLMDQLIIVKAPWSADLDCLLQRAYAEGIHTHFDTDDLLCVIQDLPLFMNASAYPMTEETCQLFFAYAARLALTASLCQSLITTQAFLAEALKVCFNKPVAIIPNFIGPQQLLISESLWAAKQIQFQKAFTLPKRFVISFISGDPADHLNFEIIASVMEQLLTEYDVVCLRILGQLGLPEPLKAFAKLGRIEVLPSMNAAPFQQAVSTADLNVIPLLSHRFNHSKSETPYIEAAIVGTLSVASPTFVYQNLIQQGKNGFLAPEGAWYACIQSLIEQPPNPEMLATTRNLVIQRYSGEAILETIESVLAIEK